MSSDILHLGNTICRWHAGALSFLHNDSALGWKAITFQLTVDGELFDSAQEEWRQLPTESDRLVVVSRPANLPVEVTVSVTIDAASDRLLLQCRYRNRSWRTVRLTNIVEGQGTVLCPQGRAFHVENIKQMFLSSLTTPPPPDRRLAWGTVLCGQNYWAELGPELVYGRSEDQPYPALFLASPAQGGGLVDAQFSQERWYREVEIAGPDQGEGFNYRAAMTTRGVRAVKVPPGGSVAGEITFLQITPHTDVQRAFLDYNRELLQRYDFRARISPNRNELIWGSWNFGIWDKCTDELVVNNARIIKEYFPRVHWVQIDAGWEGYSLGAVACPLYEGEDREKFPRGLAAVAADITALGLRPALWCGMTIKEGAQLLREHPEWLLQNEDGSPHIAGNYVLDCSRDDVRDFLVRTYRRIIREWGFEGIKLDFWTYGFEDLGIAYQQDDLTSLELRSWWLRTLRDLLPEDGYLQPGCNIASISPFVARWVDNIRYGVDVSEGADWQTVVDSAGWLAAFSLCAPGQFWLPNSDAICPMQRMEPAKYRSWMSFCAVTGSALELGGDLRQENPDEWHDAQRILAGLQVGRAFRPIDFGNPEDPVPPTLWFSDGGIIEAHTPQPAGMLCAFNWDGTGPSCSHVSFATLGLSGARYRTVDFWTGVESLCVEGIDIPGIALHDVYAVQLYAIEV